MTWQRRWITALVCIGVLGLAACSAEEKPFLILQYANPVRNQYRIKAGLPL